MTLRTNIANEHSLLHRIFSFCLGDLLYTTDIAQLRYEVIGSVEEMTQHTADATSFTTPVSRMYRSTIKDTLCISPIARCSYTHGSRQDFLLGDGG